MRVMIFDVPAEKGGALSILHDFYDEVTNCTDKSIEWIFVVSKPVLAEQPNVKVLSFPWIKKSWLHRLFFDYYVAPKLISKFNTDEILSFQNIIVPNTSVPQTLYIHQPLPFVKYKFNFLENYKFWTYQKIIGKLIKNSIKKSNKVVVQTNWMREACSKETDTSINKFSVISPHIEINSNKVFQPSSSSMRTFFFPSSGSSYKNHQIIIEACKALNKENKKEYSIIFTLNGDENKYVSELYQEVKKKSLPIIFVGNLSRQEVYEYYERSILLFPSYIETYGLPMLEAKLHKSMVFASDCEFSHEILNGYSNAYFFDPFKPDELMNLMNKVINGELNYNDVDDSAIKPTIQNQKKLINVLLEGK